MPRIHDPIFMEIEWFKYKFNIKGLSPPKNQKLKFWESALYSG